MAAYAFEGPRWASNTITWSFGQFTFDTDSSIAFSRPISDPFQIALVRDAFAEWSSVSNISFTEVADAASYDSLANIRIGYGFLNTPSSNQIGVTNYRYVNNNFMNDVTIRIEDPLEVALNFDASGALSYTGYLTSFSQVVLHEIGHALGLGHSSDPSALMYPSAGLANRDLSAADVAGVAVLYGAPRLPDRSHIANDFDGDGRSDILWQHASGAVVAWAMNGSQVLGSARLGGDNAWMVVATGDFDGDGRSDILWQHASGAVVEWTMYGSQVLRSANIGGDSAWTVVATGDFDGDGRSDILWRHASGAVAEWAMNGTQVLASAGIGGDGAWNVVATGDFNGDGRSDILWRHASGAVVEWTMNGSQVLASAGIGGDSTWNVVATGDFNGDGRSDILWRHASGAVVEWAMNGTQVLASAGIGGDANWDVLA